MIYLGSTTEDMKTADWPRSTNRWSISCSTPYLADRRTARRLGPETADLQRRGRGDALEVRRSSVEICSWRKVGED
jgi:hypothetical protein